MARTSRLRVTVFLLGLLLLASTVRAAPFSQLIVLGDSLSDAGNAYADVGYPPPPYAQRFSNGPVAVEYLATLLGVPMVNLAYGGATTGTANFLNTTEPGLGGNLPGMQQQLASLLGGPADPNALYFVWGGPNDVFLDQLDGIANPQQLIATAVTNLATIIGTLIQLGATSVLVPGMPDLGLTPGAIFGGPAQQAAATALSAGFNLFLQQALQSLPGTIYFDTFGLLRAIAANPGAYGFTNVTTPCFLRPGDPGGPSLCADPTGYLFWDTAHPTTRAHAALAESFQQAVVPEPATLLLVGSGVALALSRRRRRTHP